MNLYNITSKGEQKNENKRPSAYKKNNKYYKKSMKRGKKNGKSIFSNTGSNIRGYRIY